MAIIAIAIIYVQYTSRAVPLPEAYFEALREVVPPNQLERAIIDAKRPGETYEVYVTEVSPEGRRVTYTYEIGEDLVVHEKGMMVGYGGPNPVNTALALILGSALLSYALFIFARQLLSPRCPQCRKILSFDFLTLYAGGVDDAGMTLPPIVLRTAKCGTCGHTKGKVATPGEFRATSVFQGATALSPYWDQKLLELQQEMREQSRISHEDWKEMLARFKDQYEN